jgi:hypothetical protein
MRASRCRKPFARRGTALLALCGIVLAVPAVAEPPPIAIGGACPRNTGPSGTSSFDDMRRALEEGGERQVILDQVPVFSDLVQNNQVPGLTLNFQDQVKVLQWNQGPLESHFVKFDTDSGERCGWIARDALLPKDRGKPMTVGNLSARGVLGYEDQSKESTLDAKVLVRNRFDRKDPSASEGARVYRSYRDPRPYNTLRIFDVLNVYDVAQTPQDTWFFVGGEQAPPGGGVPTQTVYGWVRSNEVIPWSTRVTVYYSPDKPNAEIPIFARDSDAVAANNPMATREQDDTEPAKDNIPRFPLLDTERPTDDLDIHAIAFPGIACDRSGQCITARASAEKRGRVGRQVWRAMNIDFLFVIDGTESMGRYFRRVVQGIRDFLDHAGPEDADRIRFSVVVYGDFKSAAASPQDIQYQHVVPFGERNNSRDLDKLLNRPIFKDPLRDYPEAAFAALIRAVREAKWRPDAAWRMTVWIGDHPNRDAEMHDHRDPIRSPGDVAGAIQSVEGLWAAINVRGNYLRPSNDRFLSQAKAILSGTKSWGLEPLRAYDNQSGTESPQQIAHNVKSSLDEILKATKDVPKEILRRGTDRPVEDSGDRNLPHAVLARRFVEERLGLSEEELHNFFSRSQLVVEGFVRQSKDDPDWRYWLAVKPPQMGEIVHAAQRLCDTLSYKPPQFDPIRDAMLETVKSLAGDVPRIGGPEDETNIRLFLNKRLHVPVDRLPPLLDHDLDGFVAWYPSAAPSETEAFRDDMCKKATLLELARNNVRLANEADDLEYDEVTRRWRPKQGRAKEFNWIWSTEHGIAYFYVPLDYAL